MNDKKVTNQQSGIAEARDEIMISVCQIWSYFTEI
jgi:hypothetical protein